MSHLLILVIQFKQVGDQKTEPALEATLGQSSAASFATGPVMVLPFIYPLLLAITPALSSQQMNSPSFLLQALLCLTMMAGMTFFLSFWFPFLTETKTMSPSEAEGNLLRLAWQPMAAMMWRLFPPELSAQLRLAATGRPVVTLSFTPTLPVLLDIYGYQQYQYLINQSRGCDKGSDVIWDGIGILKRWAYVKESTKDLYIQSQTSTSNHIHSSIPQSSWSSEVSCPHLPPH